MARNRPPTDEIRTEIYDPVAARSKDARQEFEETTAKTEPPEHLIRATAKRSEPMRAQTPPEGQIRVISLKTPAEIAEEKRKRSARIVKPKIRSLGEISGTHTPPGGMGFLAPPRDPEQARTRRTQSNTRWAAVALAIAIAVGVGIWLVSTR